MVRRGARSETTRQAPLEISPPERRVLASLVEKYAAPDQGARATELLEQYLDEILHWTRDSNLVARSDLGRLASRHVEESVAVLPVLDNLKGQRLIDVGSGAGFPAVPIAVLRPSLEVHAVESRHRKGLFLQRLVHVLELSNLQVHSARAESLEFSTNERFDLATARAVAVVSELLPVLARLVRAGGHAVLFKGSSYEEERAAWINAGDPRWSGGDVTSVPDRHLHFLTFQRTSAE